MNAFILAGGKSMRMGRDKATLPFGGQLLIARAIESLRALHLNPRICGSRSDLANFAPITPDHFPGCGPLAGIEAALSSTDAELNLFLPVDLPDLPLPFVEWMMARAENAGAVATIPSYGGRPQPLCAIYHRAMADTLREALESRNYKVMTAVTAAAASLTEPIDAFCMESVAAALPPGVWPADPPLRHWFRNLNTPADLEYAASTPGANGRNPIS